MGRYGKSGRLKLSAKRLKKGQNLPNRKTSCGMPSCCFVPGCKSNYKPNNNVRVFKFPDDSGLRAEWLRTIQRKDLQPGPRSVVCIKHFRSEDVVKQTVMTRGDGSQVTYHRERYKLRPDAVPCIFPDSAGPDLEPGPVHPGLESELCAWVSGMMDSGQKVTPASVGAKARQLGQDRGLGTIKTDRFWVTQFFRRNNLVYTKGSGTVVKEEKDPIPLEPTVVIKEEPADYDPGPSTSAGDEFILPHKEGWTASSAVAEPQFTFSVACLSSAEGSEPPDAEPLTKKRKCSPSKTPTPATSTNGTEVRSQMAESDSGDFSCPSSAVSEVGKDQFDVFGEYIAAKLRSLDRRSCAFAQKAIGDVIFEAEMGKYLKTEPGDTQKSS